MPTVDHLDAPTGPQSGLTPPWITSFGCSPQFGLPDCTPDSQIPFESLQARVVPSGDQVTLPRTPCCAASEQVGLGVEYNPDTA
jgi:hypothetical protein